MYLLTVWIIVIVNISNSNVKGYKILCDMVSSGLNILYCSFNYPQMVEQKICPPNICTYDFDPNKRTTIIIHGYLANRTAFWIPPMIKELRQWRKKMNVITVEWFKHIDYVTAAKAVVDVADRVARMVRERLFQNSLPKKKNIHIIDHSMGAHIAGLTASILKNTSWPVDRVTGLDPAKPYFELDENVSVRLNKTVAKFVDVIHTNSDYQNSQTFGFFKPMGHIDFYPNGGNNQPDCEMTGRDGRILMDEGCFKNNIFDMHGVYDLAWNLQVGLLNGRDMICEHEIAPVYFTESLKKRHFFADKKVSILKMSNENSKCHDNSTCFNDENCIEMGIHAEHYKGSRQGSFYVNTNYCN